MRACLEQGASARGRPARRLGSSLMGKAAPARGSPQARELESGLGEKESPPSCSAPDGARRQALGAGGPGQPGAVKDRPSWSTLSSGKLVHLEWRGRGGRSAEKAGWRSWENRAGTGGKNAGWFAQAGPGGLGAAGWRACGKAGPLVRILHQE